jgi:hypothetical protein
MTEFSSQVDTILVKILRGNRIELPYFLIKKVCSRKKTKLYEKVTAQKALSKKEEERKIVRERE